MKVFVGEYVCGGGLAATLIDEFPDSLSDEGAAMHAAICRDVAEIADVITTLDSRASHELPASVDVRPIQAADDLARQWLEFASECDAAILIAPETDWILRSLLSAFQADTQIRLIAADDDFIRFSTDKMAFARCMDEAGVPHPITNDIATSNCSDSESGWIVKPRDGCGSDTVQSFDSLDHLKYDGAVDGDKRIIQTRHAGLPASIAAIFGKHAVDWLPACRQFIDPSSFAYQGGSTPLDDPLGQRAKKLAEAAVAAMPGVPLGYIGVDLVLGDTPDRDVVIEINPRLTTSYIGLRRLLRGNLAGRMLGLEDGPLELVSSVSGVSWKSTGLVQTIDQ